MPRPLAAAPPPNAPAAPPPDNYRWEVLVVVMIATLMAALDSSIVNISLQHDGRLRHHH